MKGSDIIDALYEAVGYMVYAEDIMKLPDCNNCGKKRTCEHVPRPGEHVRINCFLWEEEK